MTLSSCENIEGQAGPFRAFFIDFYGEFLSSGNLVFCSHIDAIIPFIYYCHGPRTPVPLEMQLKVTSTGAAACTTCTGTRGRQMFDGVFPPPTNDLNYAERSVSSSESFI